MTCCCVCKDVCFSESGTKTRTVDAVCGELKTFDYGDSITEQQDVVVR